MKLLRRAMAPSDVSRPVQELISIERLWLNSMTLIKANPMEPWVAVLEKPKAKPTSTMAMAATRMSRTTFSHR
ncbi:hypothetical protein VFPBJ_09477 [Purpureocillium lilacinum]|uniref:Uncharacterized protein n=1 Tax=Purpureocillium lilacinum TaxID=33203 RepID=A0A179GCH7_PURLI|nr:hypothetical protein VFPBJ_09477 [Purpureocillium lilacinum]